MSAVSILGAGLAGLAAMQSLKDKGITANIYEKNDYVGGHAASHKSGGFTFDEGPHVSFTKQLSVQRLFSKAVNDQYVEQKAEILNHWQGRWVSHPLQCNLGQLPLKISWQCLVSFIATCLSKKSLYSNYGDWCYQNLGRAFSDRFVFEYTRKYWAIEPEDMSIEWIQNRVYSPRISEVLKGAVRPMGSQQHYILNFRYPLQGGFGSYANGAYEGIKPHVYYGHEVDSVDLKSKTVEFKNGKKSCYEFLISTLPLPELILRIRDVPNDVREAALQLSCTSVALVNIGVGRALNHPSAHWMYFYDKKNFFSRAHFPHRLSPYNVPTGCGSIQLEVYYSRYKPLLCKDLLTKSIEDLHVLGVLKKGDDILLAEVKRLDYANVIFDLTRKRNLTMIQNFLLEKEIISCGRYGAWEHYWTDESIQSGQNAAQFIVDRIGVSSRE